jgi:hypothetical protein
MATTVSTRRKITSDNLVSLETATTSLETPQNTTKVIGQTWVFFRDKEGKE